MSRCSCWISHRRQAQWRRRAEDYDINSSSRSPSCIYHPLYFLHGEARGIIRCSTKSWWEYYRLLLSNYYYLISSQRLFLIVDKLIHHCVNKASKRNYKKKRVCQRLLKSYAKMWSRKSHHEDVRKLQWCSCRCLIHSDLVVKLQRNGSREKQFQSKSNTDGNNSDGKKSCVWCKEDVHSVTSP